MVTDLTYVYIWYYKTRTPSALDTAIVSATFTNTQKTQLYIYDSLMKRSPGPHRKLSSTCIFSCNKCCETLDCLFKVFRSTPEFFTHLETSPLPVKGCKCLPMLRTLMAIEQWGFFCLPVISFVSLDRLHLYTWYSHVICVKTSLK